MLRRAHLVSVSLAGALLVFLALDQQFHWLRHRPGRDAFDLNELPYLMLVFGLAGLAAIRWPTVGGTVATFAAFGFTVLAANQLEPVDATMVAIAFAVPAVLWLVAGLAARRPPQGHPGSGRPSPASLGRRDLLAGVGLVTLAALGGGRLGGWIFGRIYGPTHPESSATAVVGSSTRWMWSGAVSDTSAAVTARLVDDAPASVELWLSTSPTLADHRSVVATGDDDGLVRVDLDGLEPGTRYHYGLVADGSLDRARLGSFVTNPTGPASFRVAAASCCRSGSNGAVWDTIGSLDPHLMVVMGDYHYADIVRADRQRFREAYEHQLTRPAQAALFQHTSVAYVWDDHDWGGTDGDALGSAVAHETYRAFVPHHPLLGETSPVHQAFTIGRVRVVMTDLRSARRVATEGRPGTMLGAEQKAWFLDELTRAGEQHALTVWVNPVPWISAEPRGDDWNGFPEERREIADFIAANGLASRLCMVSGDAHMVALDDGSNNDYATAGGASFPVLQAAALDRPGSRKGGPYSHGQFPGGGQFGLIEVDDDGDELEVTLSGRDWRNRVLVSHRWTVPPAAGSAAGA